MRSLSILVVIYPFVAVSAIFAAAGCSGTVNTGGGTGGSHDCGTASTGGSHDCGTASTASTGGTGGAEDCGTAASTGGAGGAEDCTANMSSGAGGAHVACDAGYGGAPAGAYFDAGETCASMYCNPGETAYECGADLHCSAPWLGCLAVRGPQVCGHGVDVPTTQCNGTAFCCPPEGAAVKPAEQFAKAGGKPAVWLW